MITIYRTAFVVLCLLIPTAVFADGLIYQLPEDGMWVRFDIKGKATEPGGTEAYMIGILTLSSVGTAEVDGEPCRWIEVAVEAWRAGHAFTVVDKLLIPQKHLGNGKDPLEHVLKGWHKHSLEAGGTPQQIEDLKGRDARYLTNLRPSLHGPFLRPSLHGPFKTAGKLDKVAVESKLGVLECSGITAHEKTDDPRSKVSDDSTYTIRLHTTAPFGVVTWEAKTTAERDGQSLGTMTMKLKLSDFGKGAKSALPDSK